MAALIPLLVSILACGPSHEPASASPGAPQARSPEPLRVVSLSPEVSRILLELGVGDSIVAVDAASGEIPEIGDVADLGALADEQALLVAALAPDVAIGLADARTRSFAGKLEASGVRVVLLDPRSANEVDAALLRIGALVDRETRARVVAANVARDIAQIATRRDGRSRTRVAFVIGCDPLSVVGGSGLLHEALELAGAENVFHEPEQVARAASAAEIAERAAELVLDATGADPASLCFAAGQHARSVPPDLARMPTIDLSGRVRALHGILYPDGPG